MRKSGAVNIIVYHPKTKDGRQELSRRVAEIHADAVNSRLKELNCPTAQKLELLDAVIETAKSHSASVPPTTKPEQNIRRHRSPDRTHS